jgi:hypothetical protein
VLWCTNGHATSSPHSSRLAEQYPDGILPDGQRKGEKALPPHGPNIRGGEQQYEDAYRRGMGKWYAVPGMCVPFTDFPFVGGRMPPDWASQHAALSFSPGEVGAARRCVSRYGRAKGAGAMKRGQSGPVWSARRYRHWLAATTCRSYRAAVLA